MGRLARMLDTLKAEYRKAKAESDGKAISRARRIRTYTELGLEPTKGIPRPTKVHVRMLDGTPMVYFTDGSFRHFLGRAISRAACRQARKRARRAQRRSVAAQIGLA